MIAAPLATAPATQSAPPRVDIDAVDVVFDDQPRHVVQKRVPVDIGLTQRFQISAAAGLRIQAAGAMGLLPLPGSR